MEIVIGIVVVGVIFALGLEIGYSEGRKSVRDVRK